MTMKKQELIHLHGLLAEVCNHYEQIADCNIEHADYTELGVRPTSIHKSKTDHKAAVFELAKGITGSMGESEQERVPAQAD